MVFHDTNIWKNDFKIAMAPIKYNFMIHDSCVRVCELEREGEGELQIYREAISLHHTANRANIDESVAFCTQAQVSAREKQDRNLLLLTGSA